MKISVKKFVLGIVASTTIVGVSFTGASSAFAAPGQIVNPLASKTYNYSSEFGGRCIPTIGASSTHLGQDLSAAEGSKIKSIANGTVVTVRNGVGKTTAGKIVVKHTIDGKTYYSVYLHMWTASKYVKVGQQVKKDQVIAEVGNSGPSTGAHLHFEIQDSNKNSINPTTFMQSQGIDLKSQANIITSKPQSGACTYYATSDTTIKQSANANSGNVITIKKGTAVSSTPSVNTQSGNYILVTAQGKQGWMNRSYISPSFVAPAPVKVQPAPAVVSSNVKTTKSSVNMRTGAGTNNKKIGSIPKNKKVTVTGKVSKGWVEVKYNNKTGWVAGNYLK